MKTTIYHGCGSHWVRAFLHWDTHTEVVESWSLGYRVWVDGRFTDEERAAFFPVKTSVKG